MPTLWGNSRTERWRLIERTDCTRELYYHERDPLEHRNVIGCGGQATIVARLHEMPERELGPLPQAALALGTKGGKKGRP